MEISINNYTPGVKIIGQVKFDITVGPNSDEVHVGTSWSGPSVEEEAGFTREQINRIFSIIEDLRNYGILKYSGGEGVEDYLKSLTQVKE